jgi:hypothetical protein
MRHPPTPLHPETAPALYGHNSPDVHRNGFTDERKADRQANPARHSERFGKPQLHVVSNY